MRRNATPTIPKTSSQRKSFEMDEFAGQTAVLIIAHGSRHQAANDDLHALAERFAEQGEYPIVEACFLELAEPDIASGGRPMRGPRSDARLDDSLLSIGRCPPA